MSKNDVEIRVWLNREESEVMQKTHFGLTDREKRLVSKIWEMFRLACRENPYVKMFGIPCMKDAHERCDGFNGQCECDCHVKEIDGE